MENIVRITEIPSEMIEIGKAIVAEKPQIYTEKTLKMLWDVIEKNMPEADQEDKVNMLYRSIYDYWTYGNNIDEEFYYHFYEKTHQEKSTYLNGKNRLLYIYHLNDKKDAHLLNDKYEAYKELKQYYKRDVILLRSDEDYSTFCEFVKKHSSFVVKPTDLGLAVGVYKYSVSENEDIKDLFERLLEEGRTFKKEYRWSNRNLEAPASILLEEIIDQDEALARMHPASVNGIRVTTIRANGKVNIIHPWMKIGVNGEFVTGGAVGSLLACINTDTGIVETLGFNESGVGYEYHPTTGIKIPGYVIPKWQ